MFRDYMKFELNSDIDNKFVEFIKSSNKILSVKEFDNNKTIYLNNVNLNINPYFN